ncbi:MAG: hypothetical protein ACTSRW_17005 [Candidatus Helarchaeota archaeon]
MQKKWQVITLGTICGLLIIFTSLLVVNVNSAFPELGGFTRHVLFIDSSPDQPGYYIVIDEIQANNPLSQVEIFYHGRGTMLVHHDMGQINWTTSSYLNSSQKVSLLLQYFTPVNQISERSGWANHDGSDILLPYVAVKVPNAGMAGAILYPINETMDSPNFTRGSSSCWINDNDFIHVQGSSVLFTVGSVISDAKILFLRKNSTNHLTSYFVKDCTQLIYNGITYISEAIPQTVVWNGSTTQNNELETWSKPVSSHHLAGSLSIVKPSLYFTQDSLPSLRQKMLVSSPWKDWFSQLESGSQGYLSSSISAMDPQTRAEAALNLAFLSRIRENQTYLDRTKEYLSSMSSISHYSAASEYLRRSIATSKYVLALDMIHENLSVSERADYESKIMAHATSLFSTFRTTPRNNHMLIRCLAVGLLGLYFNEESWVNTALEEIDRYLNDNIRAEGACYEGQSYEAYGFLNLLPFLHALNKTASVNYFQDINFQRLLSFNVNSSSPLGTIV